MGKMPLSAFMKVYAIFTDQSAGLQPADFIEAFWGSPDQVLARIAGGDRAKGLADVNSPAFYEVNTVPAVMVDPPLIGENRPALRHLQQYGHRSPE
jgi:hypothetical protein